MPRTTSSVKSPLARQLGRLIGRRCFAIARQQEIDIEDVSVTGQIELLAKALLKPETLRNIETVANEFISQQDGDVEEVDA